MSPPPLPASPLLPYLSGACAVFLFANVGSYALVNIALVLGLLLTLLHAPFREGVLRPWPGLVGRGTQALVAWILLSQALSPETWVEGADLSPRTPFKALFGLVLGLSLARAQSAALASADPPDNAEQEAPPPLVRWVQRFSWLMLAFVAPALPSVREYRLSLYHSVYGREILGPNVLGGIFGLLLLFTLSELLSQARYRSPERILRAALLFVGVGLSGSRSCLLLVLAGSVSFGFWKLDLGRWLKGLAAGGLLLAVLGTVNPRFVPGGYTSIAWELGVRGRIWWQATTVIRRVPWLGCGARRFRDKLDEIGPDYVAMDSQGRPYGTDDTSLIIEGVDPLKALITRNPLEAHNDYLTWAAQQGIPGALLYVLLHLLMLQAAWRAGQEDSSQTPTRRAHARAVFAVVLGVGAYTFFNAVWFNKELGPVVYFFLGSALGALSTGSESKDSSTPP